MTENKILAAQFEAHRSHLRGVAYRMLGSLNEADDAVQETWLRLSRSDPGEIENLGGWLTTVVARLCLDMLRSRRSRREEPLDVHGPEPIVASEAGVDPEHEALMADSVGLALLVVLRTLAPAERIAFVLHDMFDLSFDEIAPIVGRTSTAARQLASRARRRVRGTASVPEEDLGSQREIVDAFLTASREGDLNGLLAVLAPDVVFRSDRAAMKMGGSPEEIRGADDVARTFKGRAQGARPAFVDGALGVVVAPRGRLLLVLGVKIKDGRIVELAAIADPEHLGRLDLTVIDDS